MIVIVCEKNNEQEQELEQKQEQEQQQCRGSSRVFSRSCNYNNIAHYHSQLIRLPLSRMPPRRSGAHPYHESFHWPKGMLMQVQKGRAARFIVPRRRTAIAAFYDAATVKKFKLPEISSQVLAEAGTVAVAEAVAVVIAGPLDGPAR
ncbi:hypothetical protein AWZ03_000531 [Drosophila navojoa]|uniref:Uncharacterized protein n=1 Tax=Drosophila navojoa TaxID=7232 RepID=A0A484BVZ1_DRONA|nr:hypothetical protein AWZ03_000531 [Drosophila navojoa]